MENYHSYVQDIIYDLLKDNKEISKGALIDFIDFTTGIPEWGKMHEKTRGRIVADVLARLKRKKILISIKQCTWFKGKQKRDIIYAFRTESNAYLNNTSRTLLENGKFL